MARRRLMSTDEMHALQVEISQGIRPEDSKLAPLDDVALEFWERYARELLTAQASGMTLEFNPEMPDLNDFRDGFAPV